MEYINDININEAVIHILDSNGEEPILNEYSLDLDEDIYAFLYKHIEKCFKDDELKYGRFNPERNIVKEVVQDYLIGITTDLVVFIKRACKTIIYNNERKHKYSSWRFNNSINSYRSRANDRNT